MSKLIKSFKVKITELASLKLENLIRSDQYSGYYLRIGVKSSGCEGYLYVIKWDNSPMQDRDIIFEPVPKIKFVIDKKSLLILEGSTLDYKNTLTNRGFVFINPNEKSKCGCGKSFSI